MEADECVRSGRDHAYVLGLDAAYGEGKTFFLTKFRQHLAAKHPVAFVDAWADDANDEPLLAIMAAINEVLEPFLTPGGKARTWLRGATAAALPIIGKVAFGAAKTFAKRHIGEEIPDEVNALIADKSKPTTEEEVLVAAISETGTSITNLADKLGAEMLAAYKIRQKSKQTFKQNMRALIAGLSSEEGGVRQPLFVVIDELDRCRPDYAIKVLEEVKHLFDVPGVVFIIAIHGDQLEKSISAVYGADFDAKAYLHRFFSRRYKLRRLTMKELVAARIAVDELDKINWNFPSLTNSQGGHAERNLVDLISAFCTDFGVTPREFSSIADGLRIFGRTWNEKVPIELVFVLGLLLRSVRALDGTIPLEPIHGTGILAGWNEHGKMQATDFKQLWQAYDNLRGIALSDLRSANYRINNTNFVVDALDGEIGGLHQGRTLRGVRSILDTYPDRVARFGRMLEHA